MVEQTATLDAEYSVIGCLLMDGGIVGELAGLAQPEDFSVPELRSVFKAAVKLFTAGRPVDAVTIRGVIGKAYEQLLRECIEVTPSPVGWRTYVSAMQEQTRVRRLQMLAEQLGAIRTTADARALIGQAGEILSAKNRSKAVSMSEALLRFYEEQSTKREFLSWGFDKLDTRLYSDYGDFIVLAGRPSAGKTALALQMASVMAHKCSVGFYSLETSISKITNRLVANRCVVDFGRVNRRELDETDMTRIVKWQKDIAGLDFELVHAAGMSVQDILAVALAQKHRVIFVDYLQLIRGRGKDRFEQVTSVSVDLHTMAQQHGILVVALSQLSRASTGRADQAPTLTDLRESGQIEQDADAVLALYLNEEEDAPQGDRMLRVLKNKEGTLGQFSLSFDGSVQQFAEYMPGALSVARSAKKMEERHGKSRLEKA